MKLNNPSKALAPLLLTLMAAGAQAGSFTAGDLVVLQVGATGSATTLTSKGTASFLREFSTTGTVGQTLALPTTASGLNNPLTVSGTAASEGALSLSGDGHYLVAAGYNVAVGATTQTGSTVGLVDASGNIDTSTTTTLLTGNNTRAAASIDGSHVWVTGPAGLVYIADGASGGTNIATTVNLRTVQVTPASVSPSGLDQLFGSSNNATKPAPGVVQFATNLPTATTTGSVLSGMTPAAAPSSYAFFFANPTTLFVADSTLGIQEWISSASTWSKVATLAGAFVGLTGVQSGGTVSLYATTGVAAGSAPDNSLVSIPFTFTSGATGAGTFGLATTLATATGQSAFAGVAFAPTVATPEPSALVLAGLGAAIVFALRRRGKS